MSDDRTPLSLDSAAAMLARGPETPETPDEAVETEVAPEAAETENAAVEAPEGESGAEETETEAEAAEEGEQATEEVNEEADEPALPAVDPPAFYNKAEKEAFASLPHDQQQAIARLARDGERRVNTVQQEIAEERKATAERITAIEQERNQLQDLLLAHVPQPPDEALIDANPQEYLRQRNAYERGIAQLQQIVDARQAEQAKQAEEVTKAEARHREEQAERLVELIPDLKDPVKGKQIAADLASYGKAQGYDDATLSIANANDLHILHKAMLFDRAQEAAKKAKAKPVPKVAAPGVARSKAELDADRSRSVLQKLNATGSVEDAVAALRALSG